MTDDEIIALAHKYIEFDQGTIDGATLNAELAKCRDTGELIAVGTAHRMLKGKGLVISSDTLDNPLYDRSKQIERRLTGSVKEDVGIDPLRPLKIVGRFAWNAARYYRRLSCIADMTQLGPPKNTKQK